MNWKDDPQLQAALAESRVRSSLMRSAIIWTPLFLAALVAFLFFAFDEATGGDRGSWFLVGLLTVFSVLLGFQALQPLLDLFGEPAEVSGVVVRRWSRTDSLVVRSHYIRIERKIFRIDRDLHGDLAEGDNIRVRYYPHSAAVIAVERLAPPETAA